VDVPYVCERDLRSVIRDVGSFHTSDNDQWQCDFVRVVDHV